MIHLVLHGEVFRLSPSFGFQPGVYDTFGVSLFKSVIQWTYSDIMIPIEPIGIIS